MPLDCQTPEGQRFMAKQAEVISLISSVWSCDVRATPQDQPADIDAIACRDDKLVALIEIKVRQEDYKQLCVWSTYLVTLDKLLRGQKLSQVLRTPLFLFVHLLGDQRTIYWKITDNVGEFTIPFCCEQTVTQRTCNGGEVVRTNAYLPMEHSKIIRLA